MVVNKEAIHLQHRHPFLGAGASCFGGSSTFFLWNLEVTLVHVSEMGVVIFFTVNSAMICIQAKTSFPTRTLHGQSCEVAQPQAHGWQVSAGGGGVGGRGAHAA